MRHSTELRSRIYVKVYRFLSFVENMGKTLSSKYGLKLPATRNKSAINVFQPTLKGLPKKGRSDR